ncbi:hypothetical protein FQN53_005341 [Emmonsiellopsis sp. PD_33]|nr:hypothetical protein FQN53_005341 [Emmonsiellopsis sp. PD_33]
MAETVHFSTQEMMLNPQRLKRPSFNPPINPIKKRSRSEEELEATRTQSPPAPQTEPQLVVATSAIDFEDFTLADATTFGPFLENKDKLFKVLGHKFGIEEITFNPPFLFVRSGETPPPVEERPFSIAGCVAVWLGPKDVMPEVHPGTLGEMDDRENFAEVDEELSKELVPGQMPDPHVLFDAIRGPFPDAIAVTMIYDTIVVEFEEVDAAVWLERCLSLPMAFKNLDFGLQYSNGPLANTECKCLTRPLPLPQKLDALVADDTDYVKDKGYFCPGTMLGSTEGSTITSGIEVQKGNETRVLAALHAWDDESRKKKNLGGAGDLVVLQGKTRVGYLDQRIDDTNMALIKVDDDVKFKNQFLDIDCVPQKLVRSTNISFKDTFYIDSFVTGRQHLRGAGVRAYRTGVRGRDIIKGNGTAEGGPPPDTYVVVGQNEPTTLSAKPTGLEGDNVSLVRVFATNAPEILHRPVIRAGICGSVIVRNLSGAQKVLDKGEICGVMHWADLAKYESDSKLYCFADVMDPLIDVGWECVVDSIRA